MSSCIGLRKFEAKWGWVWEDRGRGSKLEESVWEREGGGRGKGVGGVSANDDISFVRGPQSLAGTWTKSVSEGLLSLGLYAYHDCNGLCHKSVTHADLSQSI